MGIKRWILNVLRFVEVQVVLNFTALVLDLLFACCIIY